MTGGPDALCEAALAGEVTVAAMVGVAGLRPVMAAVAAGRALALANKEPLVVRGGAGDGEGPGNRGNDPPRGL